MSPMSEYMMCPVYQSDPWLAFHLGLTDFLIFLSYVAIPAGLFTAVMKLPRSIGNELKIFGVLLGIFIASCGLTHLVKVGLISYDLWDTAIIVNYVCAFASVVSAIYLWIFARSKLNDAADNLNSLMEVETAKHALDVIKKLQGDLK